MAYQHHLSGDLPLHHFTDQSQSQHNQSFMSDQSEVNPNSKSSTDQPHNNNNPYHQTAPNWLNSALLRSHYTTTTSSADTATNFLNLQTTSASNQWLPRQQNPTDDVIDDVDTADMKNDKEGGESGGGTDGVVNWENARQKAEILAHPLYEALLSEHVACLRIATPVDQLPRIDAQLAQSQNVVAKYSGLSQGLVNGDDKELDHLMT